MDSCVFPCFTASSHQSHDTDECFSKAVLTLVSINTFKKSVLFRMLNCSDRSNWGGEYLLKVNAVGRTEQRLFYPVLNGVSSHIYLQTPYKHAFWKIPSCYHHDIHQGRDRITDTSKEADHILNCSSDTGDLTRKGQTKTTITTTTTKKMASKSPTEPNKPA